MQKEDSATLFLERAEAEKQKELDVEATGAADLAEIVIDDHCESRWDE